MTRQQRREHLYKAGARLARTGGGHPDEVTTYTRANDLKPSEALVFRAGWTDEMSKAPQDRRGRLGFTPR